MPVIDVIHLLICLSKVVMLASQFSGQAEYVNDHSPLCYAIDPGSFHLHQQTLNHFANIIAYNQSH